MPEKPNQPSSSKTVKPKRADLEELKDNIKAFGLKRLKEGAWFDELVRAMLHAYNDPNKLSKLRTRYPKQNDESIAEMLVKEASRLAAVAGGASGVTTGAELASAFATAGIISCRTQHSHNSPSRTPLHSTLTSMPCLRLSSLSRLPLILS